MSRGRRREQDFPTCSSFLRQHGKSEQSDKELNFEYCLSKEKWDKFGLSQTQLHFQISLNRIAHCGGVMVDVYCTLGPQRGPILSQLILHAHNHTATALCVCPLGPPLCP